MVLRYPVRHFCFEDDITTSNIYEKLKGQAIEKYSHHLTGSRQ